MAKHRRVTIDLTQAASDEVERIRSETGLTVADIFRHSFSFLRIYLAEKKKGNALRLVHPDHPLVQVQLEIPGFNWP